MSGRIYDRELECGCLLSSDGGGGVIPCCYDYDDKEQAKKCNGAWVKFKKSKDYEKYQKECVDNNK